MKRQRIIPTVAVYFLFLLAGCTPALPYRSALLTPPPNCPQPPGESVPAACQSSMQEHTASYDLLFVEFDDQGLLYPQDEEGVGEAWQQIDNVMKQLRQIASAENGISLFVFVHGWKHNAAPDDEYVVLFRKMLHAAALVEQSSQEPHRVVGIYLAWRGLSATWEPFEELSFWDRKFTAQYVAAGSARALFSRLKGFQCSQNDPSKKEGCNKAIVRGERPKVRMMLIGHSFGGLILFNAISESLIESLTYDADSGDVTAPALRFGDLVVLLNPAFEATRYAPLHRIATQRQYSRYQAPIFVSITSSADWATGRAFPLGRFFNTIFETTASSEESEANKNTMGHVPLYITHQLSLGKDEPCAGWRYLSAVPPADQPQQMRENLAAEEANDGAFFSKRSQLANHWVRRFCGKAVLTHTQYDPNSPIWNVETDQEIIAGHNDIGGEALTNFLRQLYHDTLVYSLRAP